VHMKWDLGTTLHKPLSSSCNHYHASLLPLGRRRTEKLRLLRRGDPRTFQGQQPAEAASSENTHKWWLSLTGQCHMYGIAAALLNKRVPCSSSYRAGALCVTSEAEAPRLPQWFTALT
jgi:hypothetical protein